jgi:hypothetical protein
MEFRKLLMTAGLAMFVTSVSAQAASNSSTFPYDGQLALDLGNAYAHSLAKGMAAKSKLTLSFSSPTVVARIFKGDRRLVQISYGSDRKDAGAFVVLELCKENGLLTVVDSAYFEEAKTSPVEEFSRSNPDTYYAAPSACLSSADAP